MVAHRSKLESRLRPPRRRSNGLPSLLVIDDYGLFAQSITLVLRDREFASVNALFDDLRPEHVLEVVETLRPQLVLLDVHLGPYGSGIPLIAPLRALGARVIALTARHEPHLVAEALEAGADGLIDKSNSIDQLLDALNGAARGEELLEPERRRTMLTELRHHRRREQERRRPLSSLTPREAETLASLMDGRTADDIAFARGVAPSTVRAQIKSILRKLDVKSQVAAVALAYSVGWPRHRSNQTPH